MQLKILCYLLIFQPNDCVADIAEIGSFRQREPLSPFNPSLSILAFSRTFESNPNSSNDSDVKGCFVANGDVHGIVLIFESMTMGERLADGILRQIIYFLFSGSRWIRNGRRLTLLSCIMSILQNGDWATQQVECIADHQIESQFLCLSRVVYGDADMFSCH